MCVSEACINFNAENIFIPFMILIESWCHIGYILFFYQRYFLCVSSLKCTNHGGRLTATVRTFLDFCPTLVSPQNFKEKKSEF